ncbi:hypothetical protein NVP1047O_59 [Vibrio phage 1.047.O._10N.286.55.F2]|nr:hypothetical protein NVP1047O_59 [Vibrio phage 1.047.O._10N.286.55.F2]
MVYYLGIETKEEKEMKHKHYDKIVAKAANTELAVFYRYENYEWEEAASEMLVWDVKAEHFLCLPKHKEACLHWLNGGELNIDNGKGLGIGSYTLSIENNLPLCDFISHPEYTFIIKPKKEKRWIATIDGLLSPSAVFDDKSKLESKLKGMSYQIHEIHVEV